MSYPAELATFARKLGSILKKTKRGTETSRSKNKEIGSCVQTLHSRNDTDKLNLSVSSLECVLRRRKKLDGIEDCVDPMNEGREEYIEKSKERLIAAANISNDNKI